MAEHRGPRAVLHIDLAAWPPELPADRELDVIWWWRDLPLGRDELPAGCLPHRPLADRVAHAVAGVVRQRLAGADQLGSTTPLTRLDRADAGARAPVASVAVCTRDRPKELERCLRSVLAADPAPAEVVVIDNEPSAGTRTVVEGLSGVRYVPEPRPGLAIARNAAVAATAGEVLAFVDDDAVVHPRWLARLCAPFADPAVAAVTGLVLPAELETEAQRVFESRCGGLQRGFRPQRYGPGFLAAHRRTGAPVWRIGAGCNMALRREALELVGGFDERLGAGAAGGGEDSELWYRLLARGWTCAYEPAAVVHHYHCRAWTALESRTQDYLRGHVAALFVQFASFRHAGNLVRAFGTLPLALARDAVRVGALRALARVRLTPETPARPLCAEIRGYLGGLKHVKLALLPPRPRHEAPLRAFLRRNPFPHPLTEGFFYREKMRAIHRVAPDLPFASVLEVGGGRSGLAHMLYPEADVTNTDLDPAHARAPMNAEPRVTFVTANATALPFPSDFFDAVTLLDVLEHIPDDGAAAAEALRVLRPGGWILVSAPNLRWRCPYHTAMRPICPTSEEMIARWQHVRVGYGIEELERLFGARAAATADFINPVTVVAHDLAFSRLPGRLRRVLLGALIPITWAGYLAQPRPGLGTETAASWRKRYP